MLKRKHEHRVPLFEQENDNSVQRKKSSDKGLELLFTSFFYLFTKSTHAQYHGHVALFMLYVFIVYLLYLKWKMVRISFVELWKIINTDYGC